MLYYNVSLTKQKGGVNVDIIDIINSTVFPIAMCVIMLTQNNKTISELKNSIDNNTLTITKLVEKLDKS